MRHRNKKTKFGRTKQPRELMLRNLAASVVLYEKVITTQAKGRAVKGYVEKCITIGKPGTLTARRQLRQILPNDMAVKKIIEDIAPRFRDRPGGYVRCVRLVNRKGDNAPLARVELV